MKFARQYCLQRYKVPDRHKFSGKLLDKAYESTEKVVAPILAVAKKYGATIASDEPAMNLLCLTDSDIHWQGTGKVYHVMLKTENLLETMSVEYDFIPNAMLDAICTKWMQRWTDLHNPLHGTGYCLDPQFHSRDHSACAEEPRDLFLMCD